MCSDVELKRAEQEDIVGQRVLDEARNRPPRPMSTPESIAFGNVAMAAGSVRAAETLARRIANKELLTSDELRSALGVTEQAIDDAVTGKGLFAVEGPGGARYYPAFYADAGSGMSALELVARELGGIPSASKYHFFVSKRTSLGETPLEALKRGRVAEGLRAAIGFAIS